MFRKSYNRALLSIRVETRTPLLIAAGGVPLDPSAADLTPVRTRHVLHGITVFIPGTSLKGVLRSTVEAYLRAHGADDRRSLPPTCDPFDRDTACGARNGRKFRDRTPAQVHRDHCLACRLFGSTSMRGRGAVRDLFPWTSSGGELSAEDRCNLEAANRVELHHRVAIDRKTGSVAHGPFDEERVPAGVSFFGDIALTNYQAWQLGLLSTAFEEIGYGYSPLGHGKTSGLGLASLEVESIVHEQAARAGNRPLAVGRLVSDSDVKAYGLLEEYELPPAGAQERGLFRRFVVPREEVRAWLDAGMAALEAIQ